MKNLRAFLFAVSLPILVSCERFVEVELPGQEAKLVLNSLLESSDTLKVFLTKSRSVLDGREWEEFEFVKNANVRLIDQSGREYRFEFKDNSAPWSNDISYQLANPGLSAGQSYLIIADAPGFPEIEAVQQLPTSVPVQEVSISRLGAVPNLQGNHEYEITVKFDDLPEKNFYEIAAEASYTFFYLNNDDTIYYTQSTPLGPLPNNPALRKEHLMRNVILMSDVFLNGKNSEVAFRVILRDDIDASLTISLGHVSEAYYRYYDTADLQYYNRGDFLSQPVLVFNNIKNGLGIFKARNVDHKTIELRGSAD